MTMIMYRTDYFFVSDNLRLQIVNSDVLVAYNSDHAPIIFDVNFPPVSEGRAN